MQKKASLWNKRQGAGGRPPALFLEKFSDPRNDPLPFSDDIGESSFHKERDYRSGYGEEAGRSSGKGLLGPVTREMAVPLYVAVSTDTGCFVYGNTTADTHRTAAALMETGIPAAELNKRHFRTKTLKRLRIESRIVEGMELFDGGETAVAAVDLAMVAQLGADERDLEDIASFVGQVEGVKNAITIRELRPGTCKLSLRTDPEVLNASRVCALLGGGGHAAASGATVEGSVEEAKRAILWAIEQVRHG